MKISSVLLAAGMALGSGAGAGALSPAAPVFRAMQVSAESRTPELLVLLDLRREEVATLIEDGNLSVAYLPAFIAKDIALTLEERRRERSTQEQTEITAAARRVVLAAWRIDRDADLGQRDKVLASYREFASAVDDLRKAFGSETPR